MATKKLRVAVYAIALNEEQFVERWYNSAKEADVLLIADTGSTDKTIEKAKELGIKVVEIGIIPWRFDDARNAAVASIPKDIDYCIALDMDEILIEGWKPELEKAFENGWTRVRYPYTWNWKEDGTPGLQYGGDKIHTRKGYRWKHPVHEVMVTNQIEEIQGWAKLEIHHHADNTKSRSQYLPLLRQAVLEDLSDDRNAYYYARELFFHSQIELAKEEFKRHLSLPRAVWPPERASSMRYLAKLETDPKEKEEWFKKAVKEAPHHREAYVDLAEFYYLQNRWEECLAMAEGALSIPEKPLEYLCEEFAWGCMPYDYAAISSYNLGNFEKALTYGTKAVELNPEDLRLQSNLAFYSRETLDGNNV
jgi:glycosyltransferase involved in cell wall biosynthesis